ncbi:hypothetical protein Tco_0127748 [Tanacetum coccineum]
MFDRAFKRVNTFVDFKIDLVEGSSKKAREELEQESTKKQNMDEDKDTTELQSVMEVISYEKEVAIDVGDLKTMFEPHVKDTVWRNQQDYKVLEWKLHDSCKGRIVRIKSLLNAASITAAHIRVNAA